MPELTLENYEQISRDVADQEITFSHLSDELIDHVCCDVEEEMNKGLSFIEAYEIVRGKIGSGRFRQVQIDTLYAVDTKYRHMKNLMKISGITGTVLFGIAALFKIQHWPTAGIMMTLGALLLALLFLPSALTVLWKETHNRGRLFLFVSSFITGLLFITGTLFKTQHWPFAGVLLVFSAISVVILFIPSVLIMALMSDQYKRLRPVIISGCTGTIFYTAGLISKIQHWPLASVFMIFGMFLLGFLTLPWYTRIKWKNETRITPKFFFIITGFILITIPGVMLNLSLQIDYIHGYSQEYNRLAEMNSYFSSDIMNILSRNRENPEYELMKKIDEKARALISVAADAEKAMLKSAHLSEFATQTAAVDNAAPEMIPAGYNDMKSAVLFFPDGKTMNSNLTNAIDAFTGTLSGSMKEEDIRNSGRLLAGQAENLLKFNDPNQWISFSILSQTIKLFNGSVLAIEENAIKNLGKK